MKYIGRILGLIIGLKYGGFFGGIFGFWLGGLLDKKLKIGEASHAEKQAIFYDSTFLVMGHISKSDGKVSKEEINQAVQVMHRLGLNDSQMKRAKILFNQGKSDDFDLSETLIKFRNIVGARNQMAMMFLEIQISAALADGHLDHNEKIILLEVCKAIGIPIVVFEQLLIMLSASQRFSGTNYQQNTTPNTSQLQQAYQILGVTKTDSDAVIKRAYRKLMSQNHPDKLQSKGLSDEMLKIAANKTHTIKQAYELIKAARKL